MNPCRCGHGQRSHSWWNGRPCDVCDCSEYRRPNGPDDDPPPDPGDDDYALRNMVG